MSRFELLFEPLAGKIPRTSTRRDLRHADDNYVRVLPLRALATNAARAQYR